MSESNVNGDFPPDEEAQPPNGGTGRHALALAFATIERPQVAQRLIASARRCFPTMPIYVADQSLDVAAMSSFYAQMHVTLVRMPYDAGVCASRNRLVASIAEEYFVLCDDDFVFDVRTDFREALRILHHHPEIGVVGGKLYDYDGSVELTRRWEHFLHLDSANRTLTSAPIYHYAPRTWEIGTTRFYLCDAVMNFAVMRRAIFTQPAIRWDERFKSNGEHEDFFLNMKINSSVRVAYLPTMVAYHHHPEAFMTYRSQLRDRVEGWKLLFDKWGVDQHLEIGLGVRSIDDLSSVVASNDVPARFFLNDHLSLRREKETAALLIGRGASLSAVGMLDEAGEPTAALPTMARVLVPAGGGQLVSGPDVRSPAERAQGVETASLKTLQARYGFDPLGTVMDSGVSRVAVLFRYNPVVRSDADFVLWYRFELSEGSRKIAPAAASGAFPLHLRWFADDGRVLMWESDQYLLNPDRSDYWVPLLVEVPVFPSSCAFMQFEVVAGSSARRRPVATGFLFAARPAAPATNQRLPSPSLDVLAVTPWMGASADARSPPASLDVLECPEWNQSLVPYLDPDVPGLLLLPLGNLAGFDIVFLLGWQGRGAPLAVIGNPDRGVPSMETTHAPRCVGVPLLAWRSLRVLGFIKGQGYRRVPLLFEPAEAAAPSVELSPRVQTSTS